MKQTVKCASCECVASGVYSASEAGSKQPIVTEPMCDTCLLDWKINGFIIRKEGEI